MRNGKPVRVVIGTRYALFREGVKAMLGSSATIEVIGEAATVRETVALAERLRPDVVLIGPEMHDLSVVGGVRRIRDLNPEVKVLMMPLQDEPCVISDYLKAGAAGCIDKHDGRLGLCHAVLQNGNRRPVNAAY